MSDVNVDEQSHVLLPWWPRTVRLAAPLDASTQRPCGCSHTDHCCRLSLSPADACWGTSAGLQATYNEALLGASRRSLASAIAVHTRPLTPFGSSNYAKDYLYSHSELLCLNIKTHSPSQKKLAMSCAVNYCLLLREIHICWRIRNVSTLRHQQMEAQLWRRGFGFLVFFWFFFLTSCDKHAHLFHS